MSMQRVQGVLLFLVLVVNFARFRIVTRSYSSRPFLRALVPIIVPPRKIEINLPLPHCWLRDTITEKNMVDRYNIVPPVSHIR